MSKFLEVGTSTYYESKHKTLCNRKKEDDMYLKIIEKIFNASKKKFGSPRIFQELKALGYKIGVNRVAKIMRENGLKSTYSRPKKPKTTDSDHNEPVSPNLLNQNFDIKKPNTVWVSDITYIQSKRGWLYLCIVKDLCTREIVGYSLENHMKAEMVVLALERAVQRKAPPLGLMFHSDRGSQYASKIFREKLKSLGFVQSMSRKGNCYDNACAESFFGTLKCELVHDIIFNDIEEAKIMLYEYIEIFYNRRRRISSLGYLSPAVYATKIAA